jgi:hypothetical protein
MQPGILRGLMGCNALLWLILTITKISGFARLVVFSCFDFCEYLHFFFAWPKKKRSKEKRPLYFNRSAEIKKLCCVFAWGILFGYSRQLGSIGLGKSIGLVASMGNVV